MKRLQVLAFLIYLHCYFFIYIFAFDDVKNWIPLICQNRYPLIDQYTIFQRMQAIGVRRNLQALTKNQRTQYFWCLKMLGIIPAFKCNQNRYYMSFAPDGVNQMKLLCLHDQLITNHATCCEHGSFYFAHYHRHLMVYFEMLINYCHELLIKGATNLEKIYGKLYTDHKDRWDAVFKAYTNLQGKAQKVMAHYWNPTNYNNAEDLVIPKEISDPKLYPNYYQFEQIDYLFNQVRQHYPHEINVQQRMFNKPEKFKQYRQEFIAHMTKDFNYFHDPYTKTTEQQEMTTGTLNARSNFQKYFKTYTQYTSYGQNFQLYPNAFKLSSSRNKQNFDKTNNKMELLQLNRQEVLNIYGGREMKDQYFTLDQLQKDFSINKINYNSLLPHYQLGYALFNREQSDFTEYLNYKKKKGIQKSHDFMHDLMFFSLHDGNFSLLNLMFFPFHSWIDAMLQFRIRTDQSQGLLVKQYLNSQKERNQYFDYVLYRNNPKPIRGDYPILEWANPRIKRTIDAKKKQEPPPTQAQLICAVKDYNQTDLIGVSKSKDYILTKEDKIRTSLQLTDFYKEYYITKENISRLESYEGFATYNASFDIQIFESTYDEKLPNPVKNVQYMLEKDASNIPKYLQDMKDLVNYYNDKLQERVQKTLLKLNIKVEDDSYYLKLVNKTIFLLGKYRSNTFNGIYPISASFKTLFSNYFEGKIKFTPEDQKQLEEGFIVYVFSVFGKSNHAQSCMKCGQHKYFHLFLGEELFLRHKTLWKRLHKVMNEPNIIYCNSSPLNQKYHHNIGQLVQIKKCVLETVQFINGADEVMIQVENIDKKQGTSGYVKISLAVASIFDGEEVGTVEKKIGKKNGSFDFYNVTDNNRLVKRSHFDAYVYSKVSGIVSIGGISASFEFKIRNYHQIIKYRITTELDGERIKIKVVDYDIDFKNAFYE